MATLTDNSEMPWGKYKGTKMANVPASYLKWLWDNNKVSIQRTNGVYWYIKNNMDAIEKELNEGK